MAKSNFIIEYSLYKDGSIIQSKKMKVKNVDDYNGEIIAKLKLDKYLSSIIDYDRMEVKSCEKDYDVLNMFADIFGSGNSNPFK